MFAVLLLLFSKKRLTKSKIHSKIFIVLLLNNSKNADMAELADAHGSGPCESDFMQVQVREPFLRE